MLCSCGYAKRVAVNTCIAGTLGLYVGFRCFFATNSPFSNLVAIVMRCEVTVKIEVWSEIERAIRHASALEKYARG